MWLHTVTERVGRIERLDAVAEAVSGTVRRVVGEGWRKDLLHGTWLGHPLHPMLTDIPIGSFTSATVLDLVGGERSHRAADGLVALGVLSAVPTALAGAADWSETKGDDQRIGTVHAAANLVGVALYALSLAERRRGSRATATLLGLAGMGSMTVGGYLGGALSYSRGVGVSNTFAEDPPTEWTSVLDAGALADGEARCVDAGGVPVLLHRAGGRLTALSNRCTHAGGPLAEGEVDDSRGTVTCPWHGSVFRLSDGSVERSPATAPQPVFDAREVDGRIEVRLRRG